MGNIRISSSEIQNIASAIQSAGNIPKISIHADETSQISGLSTAHDAITAIEQLPEKISNLSQTISNNFSSIATTFEQADLSLAKGIDQ